MTSMFLENHPRPRRGLTSVALLIALFLVGLIAAAILKVAVARRAEVAREERRLQAGWLAESGMGRAAARLAASAAYTGEVWEIPADEFGGRGAGTVTIRVEPIADRPARRRVSVQADYPSGSGSRARKSQETVMEITPDAK